MFTAMGRPLDNKGSRSGIRSSIADYIRLHPGASFNNIRTIFELADGTLRYHLRYLEKRGQIETKPFKRSYFPTAALRERELSRTQQQLVHLIKEHPGMTQKELAWRTGSNRFTVRGNVAALVARELVTRIRLGREVHHFYRDPDELRRTRLLRLAALFLLDKIDEETYWEIRREMTRKG